MTTYVMYVCYNIEKNFKYNTVILNVQWAYYNFPNTFNWYLTTQTFLVTKLRDQNKNNVIETTSCFVDQLSKKYCIYYVSEHLEYCTQINKYWLIESICLNIVLFLYVIFFITYIYVCIIVQYVPSVRIKP